MGKRFRGEIGLGLMDGTVQKPSTSEGCLSATALTPFVVGVPAAKVMTELMVFSKSGCNFGRELSSTAGGERDKIFDPLPPPHSLPTRPTSLFGPLVPPRTPPKTCFRFHTPFTPCGVGRLNNKRRIGFELQASTPRKRDRPTGFQLLGLGLRALSAVSRDAN